MGDDRTGKVLDPIAAPRGFAFANVQGTSDDRTFVVTASGVQANGGNSTGPARWYLLRIAPGNARPYRLTELPIKLPASGSSAFVLGFALSPNGQELAVESRPSISSAGGVVTALGIYSAASGAKLHVATTRTNISSGLGSGPLSWLAGGRRLVFSVSTFTQGSSYTIQLRALDPTDTGTDLLADSRALITVPNSGASTCESLRITPDGATAVCATQYDFATGNGTNAGGARGGLEFIACSVRTGEPSASSTGTGEHVTTACPARCGRTPRAGTSSARR